MTTCRLMSLVLFALLLGASQALLLAPPSDWSTCIGTACLGATLALGDAAYAADTINTRDIKIDADTNVPSLIRTVQDNNRQTVLTSRIRQWTGPSEALQQVYSPAVKVQPTDTRGDTREASAAQSPLLAQLPFLQSATSTTIMTAQAAPSFWDRPFFLQPIPNQYEYTNKNVLGSSALALGGLYAFSYGYYQNEIVEEEAKARRKKEAMAAKREAAAKEAAAEQDEEEEALVEENDETLEEVPVIPIFVPPLSPEEELAVEKARAAVEKAKRSGHSAMTAERNRQVEDEEALEFASETSVAVLEQDDDDELPPKKRKRLKFWRWMKRDYGE